MEGVKTVFYGEAGHNGGWGVSGGEICRCQQCRQQCKIFASCVNFSIFTHVFVLLSPKLLKFGKIKGVKFLA